MNGSTRTARDIEHAVNGSQRSARHSCDPFASFRSSRMSKFSSSMGEFQPSAVQISPSLAAPSLSRRDLWKMAGWRKLPEPRAVAYAPAGQGRSRAALRKGATRAGVEQMPGSTDGSASGQSALPPDAISLRSGGGSESRLAKVPSEAPFGSSSQDVRRCAPRLRSGATCRVRSGATAMPRTGGGGE